MTHQRNRGTEPLRFGPEVGAPTRPRSGPGPVPGPERGGAAVRPSARRRAGGARAGWLVGLTVLAAACASSNSPVASVWPPDDFELIVEELAPPLQGAAVRRRFTVQSDGICVYAESEGVVGDPATGVALPVFGTVCAYKLLEVNTRLLARRLKGSKVLELDPVYGDDRTNEGRSIRLSYRAFGAERLVVAAGQIDGSMVQVLHTVNAFLPKGREFDLPGMVGDADPKILTGVPEPVTDLQGAASCYDRLLARRPYDEDLLLSAYALACRLGDRSGAEQLLVRWAEAAGLRATSDAPFSDPPRLTVSMLESLLPG